MNILEAARWDVRQFFAIFSGRMAIVGLVTLVLFICSIFLSHPVFFLFAWVFAFAVFDILGYYHLVVPGGKRVAYRVIQTMYQIVSSAWIYYLGGIELVVAANIVWITLGCDMIYLWERRVPPFAWDYFYISPVIAFYKFILRRPAPWVATLISAAVGVILAVYIVL